MSILFSRESQIEAKCIIQARNAGEEIAFSFQRTAISLLQIGQF